MPNSRDSAINLFAFLKEYARLSHKPVRSLDSERYREVFWFGDVPREPECSCVLWEDPTGDGGHPARSDGWLEIRRPQRSEPPDPPEEVMPWVNKAVWTDSSLDIPELYRNIRNPDWSPEADDEEVPERLDLADFPEIREAWDQYVADEWWAWAEDDRCKEKVQERYNQLFRLRRAKLQMGDQYELLLAVGCVHWMDPNKERVKRHTLTIAATVEFDSINASVTVRPDGSMVEVQLETDMLTFDQQPDAVMSHLAQDRKAELGAGILSDKAKELLSAWANSLPTGNGKFIDTLDAVATPSPQEPEIHFSPALILRKRSSGTLIEVYEKIEADLRDIASPLPATVRKVVGELGVDDQPETGDELERSGYAEPDEIFFPLAANDEQIQVLRRLERQTGVLVEGPPGTGKSLTIANLICHLLANGKRILVTSQKAPALRVLKNKLPPEVADLCVLLLGEGNEEQLALRRSVAEISRRYTAADAAGYARRSSDLRTRLRGHRAQEAKMFEALCLLRSKEEDDYPVQFGDYAGKLRDIAKRLRSEKDGFAWFEDHLSADLNLVFDETPACPVSNAEALTALDLLRRVSREDEERCRCRLPNPEVLPSPEEFATWVREGQEADTALTPLLSHLDHPARDVFAARPDGELSALAKELRELIALRARMLDRASGWETGAVRQLLAGESAIWTELQQMTTALLKEIEERLPKVADLEISGLGDRSRRTVLKDARELYQHLCNGGKLSVVPFFEPPVVKQARYLTKVVHVDGRPCKSCEPLGNLIQWLELQEAVRRLEEQWRLHLPLDATQMPLNQTVSRYRQELGRLEAALALGAKAEALEQILLSWNPGIDPAWDEPGPAEALERLAEATLAQARRDRARTWFGGLCKTLASAAKASDGSPEAQRALQAVETRASAEYGSARRELQRLNDVNKTILDRDQRLAAIAARLPRLAAAMSGEPTGQAWPARLETLEAAWSWKCADAWLQEISAPGAEHTLQMRLKNARDSISRTLAELAAELAWQHCVQTMSEPNYASLKAWEKAIGKLGKGTGKYSERNRVIARERLEECRGAVPAWVMPLHKVLDTVKIEPGIFDVVIVDEASQSGPEALFLSYLAKKMVVVGDDEQIRPDTVGLEQSQVHQLQAQLLMGVPNPEIFDPTESLFGVAQVRFGNPVRLREHFRCMPEIIGFSNQLSYGDQPLLPLRQFGGDRLEPVLKTTYVTGAFQEAGKVNKVEAERLVEAIAACCEDPRYAGKKIGVISLLNTSDQDRYIEQLLVKTLDSEEIENRNIVCGDAYDFQGDERDIVFLSMVSARSEGNPIGTLSDGKARRRFNVAASRAKDQLWLFHSVHEADLRQNCLRRRLLRYMESPKADPLGGTLSMPLAELHRLAKATQRRVGDQPHPFDSWFEVDVYLEIASRQYLVIPQYEVSGYRIDMVIVGGSRKLAVECDGDYWHGPERYQQDLRRQHHLERCGWEFFRVRSSTFYYDPQQALEKLWGLLAHKDFGGIEEEEDTAVAPAGHAEDGPEETSTVEAPAERREPDEAENEQAATLPQQQSTLATAAPPGRPARNAMKPKLDTRNAPPGRATKREETEIRSAENLLALSNGILGKTVMTILKDRPNHSCKKEALTTLVCQFYGVRTRGTPKEQVRRRLNGAIASLVKRKLVREYKVSNVRIQLLPAGEAQVAASPQLDFAFSEGSSPEEDRATPAGAAKHNGRLDGAVTLLRREPRPWSRAELIRALDMPANQWAQLATELTGHPEVLRTGERLTTRYQVRTNLN